MVTAAIGNQRSISNALVSRMIIHRDKDLFVCISQPDHAALAATVIGAWHVLGDHPRRDAILFATREHDNGWIEEDAATHVGATGEPLDFVDVPAAVKHRIWPRAIARFEQDRPYESALIAQHALTVHDQNRGNPDWQPFFAATERRLDALLARCGAEAAHTLPDDYVFVRQADVLSLIFCDAWKAAFPRPELVVELRDRTLVTSPDPFAGARVPLEVVARRIPACAYATARDLRRALDDATPFAIRGEAVGESRAGSVRP